MQVQLITRPTRGMTGTNRYVQDLCAALPLKDIDLFCTTPAPSAPIHQLSRMLRPMGMNLQAFLESYPLNVQVGSADVCHITNQTMATLLAWRRFSVPVVVTVLDIIPYLLRHDPELNTLRHSADALFYRLVLRGLRRADALIAISDYTRQTLIETLNLPPERIHVTPLTVDSNRFQPLVVGEDFRRRYGLDGTSRYILFVGSEDPRKNIKTLIQALAQVKGQMGAVKLLKVGRAHFDDERTRLKALIASFDLTEDVLFFDEIAEDELPLFYNVADVLVMPSLYEGFGLPVLEAMACGTSVIAAQTSALIEVVGDAGIQVAALDDAAFADAIVRLLQDRDEQAQLAQRGLERVGTFSSLALAQTTQFAYLDAIQRCKR